jgi:hypothetical protein
MRLTLFATLFCVFILSGQALAQDHKWVEVRTPRNAYNYNFIDVNNIKRLPNGFVTYLEKSQTGDKIIKSQVQCELKTHRVVGETILDYRDAYGNLARGTPSRESYPTPWRTIEDRSRTYYLATEACQSASWVTESVPRPSTTRRVVKRTRKGKS